MGSYYELLIQCKIEQHGQLNEIFKKQGRNPDLGWSFIIEEDSNLFTKALNLFCAMIGEKLGQLKDIGIQTDMISFWYMYEYEQQCNMEFSPQITKKMGDLGVVLCISCWQK